MKKAVYTLLCENMENGKLKQDFALPEEYEVSDSPIRYAPGARDGISIYHTALSESIAEKNKQQMIDALKYASEERFQDSETAFNNLTKETGAINYVNALLNYVAGNAAELKSANIFKAALSMILHSDHAECVKIGLVLLNLFAEPSEKLKEVIRCLGLYDEFTLYSVWNMMRWTDGNTEIFNLAKNVFGWGRIHAVKYLKPETEEIRRWLLTEGTVNGVINAYSSLECWTKSHAREILFGKPTQEEFKGLSTIISGLADESPVPGMSALKDAEDVLLRFLSILPDYSLDVSDYNTVYMIQLWTEDFNDKLYEYGPEIKALCHKILYSDTCINAVKDAKRNSEPLYYLGFLADHEEED